MHSVEHRMQLVSFYFNEVMEECSVCPDILQCLELNESKNNVLVHAATSVQRMQALKT